MSRHEAGRRGIAAWLGAVALSALLLAGGNPAPVAGAAQSREDSLSAPTQGAQAVAMLGPDLVRVAANHDLPAATLRDLLLADPTLWVDPCNRLFYVDPPVVAGSPPSELPASGAPEAMPFPADQTFLLHSRPGANRVIYLDFDGEPISGTAWNSYNDGDPFTAPPYDIDGSPATFSSAELTVIQDVWQRVTEDYAPFSVDVTTQDPGLAAIDRNGAGDTVYGARALITNDSLIQGQCGCGGIAYVDVFDELAPNHQFYQPAFVFQRSLGDGTVAKLLAEAASHEVGHNLGLSHDGTASAAYYSGQASWAPIMGVGYSRPIVQWSRGEYAGANNSQDDLAIMVSNGAPLRPDDYPSTRATAFALGAGASLSASGFIGTRTDVDWFSFVGSGPTSVTVTTALVSPDLDALVGLYNSAGTLLASDDPPAATVSQDVASGLGASISFTLPSAGTYYVSIDGVGFGTALATGYSDYASLGEYSLSLTTGSAAPTVSSIAPPNGPPAGGTAVTVTGTNLSGATAVSFGATAAASFTVDSPTSISAVSPAGTGTVDIRVSGPSGTSATSSADQFIYLAGPSGATYVSLAPARILDTRIGNGLSGTFNTAIARTWQVTGRGGVPAGAIAVTGNLTVTNQTAFGHVALTPAPTDSPTTSTLNFPVGDNRANGVTAPLGAGGTLSATYISSGPGQTTDLVFDVTGYFVAGPSGATYVSLAPARILDTRIGNGLSGTFNTAIARTWQVTGRGGVPAGAIAVTGNLTVTNQTAFGHVALTPAPTDSPTTSTLNFPVGDNRANGVTAPLGAGGTLSATYISSGPGQTTDLVFDVTGYFVAGPSGATYVSLAPARILDTRIGNGLSGTFNTAIARTWQVTGRGGVPAGAIAVTGNLTVTNQTAFGHVALTPAPTDSPTTSTLNFPVGDNRANGVTAPLGAGGTLSATYISSGPGQTTDLVFDVTGYFVD